MSSTKLEDLPDNVSVKVLEDLRKNDIISDDEYEIDSNNEEQITDTPYKFNEDLETISILTASSFMHLYSMKFIKEFIRKYTNNNVLTKFILSVILVVIYFITSFIWKFSKKNIL